MTYHINPFTGETNVCNAKIKCKFGMNLEHHYQSKTEAQKAYEENMKIYSIENVPEIITSLKNNSQSQHIELNNKQIIDKYKSIIIDNNVNKDQVVIIAMKECIRQDVGFERLDTLLNGYNTMQKMIKNDVINADIIEKLGGVVEPDNNGRFRITPVTFQDGGTSANHQDIPRLMHNLFTYGDELTAEQFTKEFLWIHPFNDGNGRTGWLIHNWKNNSLGNPIELPKLF